MTTNALQIRPSKGAEKRKLYSLLLALKSSQKTLKKCRPPVVQNQFYLTRGFRQCGSDHLEGRFAGTVLYCIL